MQGQWPLLDCGMREMLKGIQFLKIFLYIFFGGAT